MKVVDLLIRGNLFISGATAERQRSDSGATAERQRSDSGATAERQRSDSGADVDLISCVNPEAYFDISQATIIEGDLNVTSIYYGGLVVVTGGITQGGVSHANL